MGPATWSVGRDSPDDDTEGYVAHLERRYPVLSVRQLLQRRPPSWLIRGLLSDAGINLLVGASGAGKTHVATSMAVAISRGDRWFGRRTRSSNVVLIAAEGAPELRIAAILRDRGLAEADLPQLHVMPVGFRLFGPNGDTQDLLTRLQMLRAIHGEIGLVIIDTLSRVLAGADENHAGDMGLAIEALSTIQSQLKTSVMAVHHLGKDLTRGARGHSALTAAADAVLSISRDGDMRTLSASKVRDGADGQAILTFRLKVVDLGPASAVDPDADDDERLSSCVIEEYHGELAEPPAPKPRGRVQQAVLDQLAAAGSPITRVQLLEHMARAGFTNRSGVYGAIDALLRAGLVVEGLNRLYLNESTGA